MKGQYVHDPNSSEALREQYAAALAAYDEALERHTELCAEEERTGQESCASAVADAVDARLATAEPALDLARRLLESPIDDADRSG